MSKHWYWTCDKCRDKYFDNNCVVEVFGTVHDLCPRCAEKLKKWFYDSNGSNEEHIERFIKRRVFKLGKSDATAPCILVNHFIDALMKFFNYRWEEEVDNFISENTCLTDRITVNKVKECLAKYFDYEWRDEFYNYG